MEVDQPDWKTAMQTVTKKENFISELSSDNAKYILDNNHQENLVNINKKDLEDYNNAKFEYNNGSKKMQEVNCDYDEAHEIKVENVSTIKDIKNRLIDLDSVEDERATSVGTGDKSELELSRTKNTHKTLQTKIQTLQNEIDKLEMKSSQNRNLDSSLRNENSNSYVRNSNEKLGETDFNLKINTVKLDAYNDNDDFNRDS